MARSVTLKINGKDVWESFGLDVISTSPDIMGMPELEGRGFEVVGRDGSTPSISGYKARKITINGIMVDSTHANLLAGLKDLKQEIAGGHHGRRRFRIDFTDDSNVYYLARAVSMDVSPIAARFIAVEAQISLTIIIEDAVGRYDTFALSDLEGSPFSSPYGGLFVNNGSAIMRPRILLENVEAGAITDISLINIACRNRLRTIAPNAGTQPAKAVGRWGDVAGAGYFATAGTNYLRYTSQGLFNPACFSFFCFFKIATSLANLGYIFSTTGNIVKLYYDSGNTKIVFDVNGNIAEITDGDSQLVINEWFAIGAIYNIDGTMGLNIYRISNGNEEADITVSPSDYHGLPTDLYIGSDATPANVGGKALDDIRIYSRDVSGIPWDGSSSSEWNQLSRSLGPLPMGRQTALYIPFDYKTTGLGFENSQLDLTPTVAQNKFLEIKCDEKDVYLLDDTFDSAPASQMASVSGEFPFFVPGYNSIQVIHDGDASSVNLAIADERRYL